MRMKIEALAGALASSGGTPSGAALPGREVVPGPSAGLGGLVMGEGESAHANLPE